ncbi:MAG: UbiH/UbiF/VisC/COQ6 family ubiquinone biosynthesis hydroxylase [Gammaproteobacteria bacterium]|nr:UbiH/UbiF/VisC/COQ6 family ubiquinone biosynthesis hydroxylase [Gammaproteobacteria bacterium]
MSKESAINVDVVIVGAGMVGLTLANLLSKQGKSLAIIDRNIPQEFDTTQPYDARVTAVSPGSQAIFEHVNAWSSMQAKRITPFNRMVVWDAVEDAKINFSASDIQHENLGHIVENLVIQTSLHEALQPQTNINWFVPVVIGNVLTREDHIEVVLDNDQVLTAKLLVGADGRRSSVRKFANINYSEKSYQQQGIVARVQTEHPHEDTAWQRFLSTGPLALLPLNNGECSIVWSVNDEEANELMELGEHEFAQALTKASGLHLGNISLCSKRATFPLVSGQAESMVQPRIALVGDAAHALHPLAGQGANLGFTDAAILAEVLAQTERDIGSVKVLRKYERARVGETQVMQRAMDAFVAAFSSTSTPVITARNYALNAANRIQPIKKYFMKQAMGLSKNRPGFAR